MGPRHCRLPWRRLVAGWDQADAHVETVQARGVEVAAEQSEVGSWARPCGLDQHPVARRGDANHGPARIVGQVLGQRLHVALPDGGLVDPIRVDLQMDDHRQQEAGNDGDGAAITEGRSGRLAGDPVDPVGGHDHDAAGEDRRPTAVCGFPRGTEADLRRLASRRHRPAPTEPLRNE